MGREEPGEEKRKRVRCDVKEGDMYKRRLGLGKQHNISWKEHIFSVRKF